MVELGFRVKVWVGSVVMVEVENGVKVEAMLGNIM